MYMYSPRSKTGVERLVFTILSLTYFLPCICRVPHGSTSMVQDPKLFSTLPACPLSSFVIIFWLNPFPLINSILDSHLKVSKLKLYFFVPQD